MLNQVRYSVATVRSAAKPHQALAQAAPPGTSFVEDRWEPSSALVAGTPEPARPAHRPNRWLALATLAGVLSSGSAALAVPLPPAQEQYQPAQAEKLKGHVDEDISKLYAQVKDVTWSESPRCIYSSPACAAEFKTLPANAQQQYLGMPLAVKKLVAGQIQGHTTIIPLILKIDHREAFVKGRALGHDVFDFVQGRIDQKLQKGEIKPEHGPRIRQFLDVCRQLTPEQRSALVDLLSVDAGVKPH